MSSLLLLEINHRHIYANFLGKIFHASHFIFTLFHYSSSNYFDLQRIVIIGVQKLECEDK